MRHWDDDMTALAGMLERLRNGEDDLPRASAFVMLDFLAALDRHHQGAVRVLREIKRVAAIEAPPVSDEVLAKVWKLAFDALNTLRGQS
jgi:hypothetical protein